MRTLIKYVTTTYFAQGSFILSTANHDSCVLRGQQDRILDMQCIKQSNETLTFDSPI